MKRNNNTFMASANVRLGVFESMSVDSSLTYYLNFMLQKENMNNIFSKVKAFRNQQEIRGSHHSHYFYKDTVDHIIQNKQKGSLWFSSFPILITK